MLRAPVTQCSREHVKVNLSNNSRTDVQKNCQNLSHKGHLTLLPMLKTKCREFATRSSQKELCNQLSLTHATQFCAKQVPNICSWSHRTLLLWTASRIVKRKRFHQLGFLSKAEVEDTNEAPRSYPQVWWCTNSTVQTAEPWKQYKMRSTRDLSSSLRSEVGQSGTKYCSSSF